MDFQSFVSAPDSFSYILSKISYDNISTFPTE